MSHWVSKKTSFQDIEALKDGCKMLKLPLVENEKARGWNGNKKKADYVIKLPGPYDVALVKNQDAYDISADWYGGHVENIIGKDGNKLKQAYTAAVTVRTAKQNGHDLEMQRIGNGDIKLVIKVGARG